MLHKVFFFTFLFVMGLVLMPATFALAVTTVGNNVTVGGTLDAAGVTTLASTLAVTGATTLNGAVTLGDSTGDAITITGRLAADFDPAIANTYDFGSYTLPYKDVFASGTVYANTFYGGTLTATSTVAFNGAVTLGDAYSDNITINGRIASSLWASSTLYIGSAGGGEDLVVTNNAVTVGTSVNSSTLAVFGNTTLTGSLLPQTNHNKLYDLGAYDKAWQSIYVSSTAFLQDIDVNGVAYSWPSSQGAATTYLKNDGSGILTWASAGGTNDWGRFASAYGASALMTSSTYPVLFDGAVYASSTLITSGAVTLGDAVNDNITVTGRLGTLNISDGSTATTTITYNTIKSGVLTGTYDVGKFFVDTFGNVSASGTLKISSPDTGLPVSLFTTADGNVRIATSTDAGSGYSLVIGRDTMGFLGAILADGSIIPVPQAMSGSLDLGSSVSKWDSGYFSALLTVSSALGGSNLTTAELRFEDFMLNTTSTYGLSSIKLGQTLGTTMLDNGRIYLNSSAPGVADLNSPYPYMRIWYGATTSTFSYNGIKLGQTATTSVMLETIYDVGKFYADAATGNVSTSGTLQILGTATSTLKVDSSSGNKGACLKFQDVDGAGYTYCYYLNGVQTCSIVSCQ